MKKTISVACMALLVSACSKPAPAPEPVRAVKVMTVAVDNFDAGTEYAGEVRAQRESRLGFRVGGKITARRAELGQRVKLGQVLAELDATDYQLAADAARAQVAAARTNRDLAAADFKRYRELREQNFISSAELERREASLKAAQAQVEQSQSQLAAQTNQVSYAALVADMAGVVTAVEAEAGQVVAAGSPVFRIAADGPRDAVFAVPEDRLSGIRPGLAMQIKVWPGSNEVSARVREIAASADPVTRTYQVKAALQAGPNMPALGATVTVLTQGLGGAGLQGRSVIKLPTSALRQEGQGTVVWVLDTASMTVRSQAVQIATADGNDAVIASGLVPGMQVVSAGVHVLSPGQKVTIFQPRAAVTPALPNQTLPLSAASVSRAAGPAAK